MRIFTLIISALLLITKPVIADELKIAVASNFSETIKYLSAEFESQTNHKIKLIFGSTGRHYAQIKNGAPFDIFFAADRLRPQILEKEGLTSADSRFTYAIGKLVLWSPDKRLIDSDSDVLEKSNFDHLSIANPKLSPYGKAAQDFLQSQNLWNPLKKKMVRGENISQAFHFVKSGNAKLGLVAYSQVKHPDKDSQGSFWEVPSSLYSPIEQQVVMLKYSQAGNQFLDYIKSNQAKQLIWSFGYEVPNDRLLAFEKIKNETRTSAQ